MRTARTAIAPQERKGRLAGFVRHGVGLLALGCALASGHALAADPAAPEAAAPASAPTPAPSAAAPAPQVMATSSASGSQKTERLQVTDPYIELRTGPGRGFPIFFVTKRGDFIEIELRHTDWYRVKTDDGKVGWVTRQQLESTLTAAGGKKSFRDVLLDDFLSRKVQLGAAWGHFHSEPMLKLWTSYRFSETLSLEGTIGQVQGVFSGSDFWHLNVVAEPWSDRRFSPFFGVGIGKFKNFPNLSLIGATTTDAKLANAQVGVRYHLTDRFVLQVDYTLYTAFVSDLKSTEYRALTAGVSFFF